MIIAPQPPITDPWGQLAQDPGDMVQPTQTQIDSGWPESATPPARQWFNWLFYFLTNAIRYFSQRGLSDYNAGETYQLNARIIGDDGNTYTSIINSNSGNTPSTSPSAWTQWGFTLAQLASLLGLGFPSTGGIGFSVNSTVTAGQMGNWGAILVNGVVVTLPQLSAVQVGETFTLAATAFSGSVAAHAGDTITGFGSSITLAANQAITLASDGVNGWYVVMNSVTAFGFAVSTGLPGYIKLPTWLGGIIFAWGQGSPSATTINVAFPLTMTAVAVLGTTKTGTQTFTVDISGNNWSLTGNGTYWLFAVGH